MSRDEGLLRYLHPVPVAPRRRPRVSKYAKKAWCRGCDDRKPRAEINEDGRCRGCAERRRRFEEWGRRVEEREARLRAMPLPSGVKLVEVPGDA